MKKILLASLMMFSLSLYSQETQLPVEFNTYMQDMSFNSGKDNLFQSPFRFWVTVIPTTVILGVMILLVVDYSNNPENYYDLEEEQER